MSIRNCLLVGLAIVFFSGVGCTRFCENWCGPKCGPRYAPQYQPQYYPPAPAQTAPVAGQCFTICPSQCNQACRYGPANNGQRVVPAVRAPQ